MATDPFFDSIAGGAGCGARGFGAGAGFALVISRRQALVASVLCLQPPLSQKGLRVLGLAHCVSRCDVRARILCVTRGTCPQVGNSAPSDGVARTQDGAGHLGVPQRPA